MSSTKSSELFNVFVEAQQALEQLPKARADLAEALELAESYDNQLTLERNARRKLQDEYAALTAALAQKEAELSDVTFRHNESQAIIAAVRGIIPGVVATPPATAPVEGSTAQGSTSTSTSESSPTTEAPTSEAPNHPLDGHAANPESHGTSEPAMAEPTGNGTSPTDTEDREPAEPRWNPEPANHPAAVDASSDYHEPSPDAHRYWRKPDAMTWNDWSASGGEVPSWITDHSLT